LGSDTVTYFERNLQQLNSCTNTEGCSKFILAALRKYTCFVPPSLKVREEEGLSVLEKEVLRKICGLRGRKMTARYTKLHKKDL